MEQQAFIAQLLAAAEEEWQTLLQAHEPLVDRPLAWTLKAAYDEAAERDPLAASHYALLVTAVASRLNDPEVDALGTWLSGLVAMDQGQFAEAHAQLSLAREQFLACNQPLHAAATQISNFRVLAMLGRDEEAIQWGEWARTHFEAAGDQLGIGKILLNLGILHFFRDRYGDAEALFRQAHIHFTTIGDQNQLLSVENNLATVLTAQYNFDEVHALYQQALIRAESGPYEEEIAGLQCNLGCLALFQGRFDQALDYLERSRRRYMMLNLPHESAIADQEIADVYLELNLAPEAMAIYAQLIPRLAALGMSAEQARALAYHGRFRSDNPLFSALQLSDGWLTVHDAAQLNLHCNLVTLSACETGLNAAAPGDEILGLTRGFLLAGAPALLMSLWTVDDRATAQFMQTFYTQLRSGVGTAAALRHAQLQLLATDPHPFFWAPFILVGRWT